MARTKPSYQYIWQFDDLAMLNNTGPELIGWNTGSKSSGLQLLGFGGSSNVGEAIDPDITDYNYINVSREFPWTLNNERDEVPRIILKEMEFATSSMMQQSTYYLSQFAAPLMGVFGDPLSPYKDIYVTYDSGFIYDLPFFTDDSMATGDNSWDRGEGAEGMIKGVGGMLQSTGIPGVAQAGAAVQLLPDAANMMGGFREFAGGGAGHFVEQPKFYQHGGNTKSYQVTFPLFNTGDLDDLIRNFQLAFMLVYQNNPNREDKQLIRPPSIYELTIPGVAYCPYVQMQRVSIKFLGARRELQIPIPFEGGDEVQMVSAIIPDAYLVELTIQELVGTTRNFMYHNLDRKISTGTKVQGRQVGRVASAAAAAAAAAVQDLGTAGGS